MRTHAKICSRKPALLHPEPSVEEVPPAKPEPESDREDPNAPLEVIRCENCDRLFDSKGALMGHLNFCRPGSTPMNNDQLFYSCPICSVSFTRKPRLEAHLNKHNGELCSELLHRFYSEFRFRHQSFQVRQVRSRVFQLEAEKQTREKLQRASVQNVQGRIFFQSRAGRPCEGSSCTGETDVRNVRSTVFEEVSY